MDWNLCKSKFVRIVEVDEEQIKSIIENEKYEPHKSNLSSNYLESQLMTENSCMLSHILLSDFHIQLIKRETDLFHNICNSLILTDRILVLHIELLTKYLLKSKDIQKNKLDLFNSLLNELFIRKKQLNSYKYFKTTKVILVEYNPPLENIKLWLKVLLDSIENNSANVKYIFEILVSLINLGNMSILKDVFGKNQYINTRRSIYSILKNDTSLKKNNKQELMTTLGNY